MGRIAHSRLDELRKCVQPMSWMDDDEVIEVLNELWSARETISDLSTKIIQNEKQLAALRSQLEEQREKLEHATEYTFGDTIIGTGVDSCFGAAWIVVRGGDALSDGNGVIREFGSFDEAYAATPANWLTPHAEKGGGE